MRRETDSYDVAVIGAGPIGCASALACARAGHRVLLLEQDPFAATERVVGEWLHPPAMDVLDSLGVELTPPVPYPTGKGFVLVPDDGSDPVVLPYRTGRFGFSLEHGLLVETLRAHAERHDAIDYLAPARAVRLERGALTFEQRGRVRTVRARRIVGATGAGPRPLSRGGVLTFAARDRRASHRVAAVTLRGVELPFEGYLHVCVGGPGPAVAYRIGPARVRLLLDVPLSASVPRDGGIALYDAFAPALPRALADALEVALREGPPVWSYGELRPRTELAKDGVAWVGDAAGSYHPLTAIDLTLGLGDAMAVARAGSPSAYRRARKRRARVQESIAVGLHELFADASPETLALRRAVYGLWRAHPRERLRTMGFVAGEGSVLRFGASCLRVMARGAAEVWDEGARTGSIAYSTHVGADLFRRIGWMLGGSLGWTDALPRGWEERLGLRGAGRYGAALHTAWVRGEVVGLPASASGAPRAIERAIERGVRALLREQAEDGSFEGEAWSGPALTAQYVLAQHAMDRPIDAARRRAILLSFARTRLPSGAWSAGAGAEADLGATTLVYVASRLLGLAKDDPLLSRAHAFLRAHGGALEVAPEVRPWLALVGLFEWDGAVAPSGVLDPRPRAADDALLLLAAERYRRAPTPTVRALRDEIFLSPYEEIDFAACVRPGLAARALARLARARRERPSERRVRIREALRASSHAGLSPADLLLDAIALRSGDAEDPDASEALERVEVWIWEDEERGARVAPLRTATWDTALALQALGAASLAGTDGALRRADAFLRAQQVRVSPLRERADVSGGYCAGGAWQGRPDPSATAEVLIARLGARALRPDAHELLDAAAFLLRAHGRSKSKGEARSGAGIDVERTAAVVSALAAFRARCPDRLGAEIDAAIDEGVAALRRAQRPDGSWRGTSGVYFLSGTRAAVRGLRAGGVPAVDPQIRRACAWLKERQRADGGWGEHASSVRSDRYVEHEEPQVVQTAWALSALLEAEDPEWGAVERAAAFLASAQREDGTWPAQDPDGLLPSGALVARGLAPRVAALFALGTYARRARERALADPLPRERPRPSPDRVVH